MLNASNLLRLENVRLQCGSVDVRFNYGPHGSSGLDISLSFHSKHQPHGEQVSNDDGFDRWADGEDAEGEG